MDIDKDILKLHLRVVKQSSGAQQPTRPRRLRHPDYVELGVPVEERGRLVPVVVVAHPVAHADHAHL